MLYDTIEKEYDGYFLWLCNIVDCDMNAYSELLYILYNTDFVWSIQIDENFAMHGLKLRDEYHESDLTEDWIMFLDDPCTALEALLAMSFKMDELTEDENTSNRSRVWFWEFIRNLRLRPYTNDRILAFDGMLYDESKSEVIEICSKWMHRDFDSNGEGSPFPLNNPPADQKTTPIIYQLNNYAMENEFD